jgi:hypothetical protein
LDPITIAYLTSAAAGLTVAAVTGSVAYFRGKKKGVEEYEQQCEANIREYAKLLGAKIKEANSTEENDFESLVRLAGAVVKMRDDFKEDLDDLRKLLNSTIDELAEVLGARGGASLRNREPQIRRLVGTLNESWHAKEPLIESKLRALLAKLGIFKRRQ